MNNAKEDFVKLNSNVYMFTEEMTRKVEEISSYMENNSYLILNDDKSKAVVIDPSWNQKIIQNFLDKYKINLVAIIFTHSHFDHIGNSKILKDKYKTKFYINGNGKTILLNGYKDPKFQYDFKFRINDIEKIKIDEILNIHGIKLETLYTPGHSIDSTCFRYKNFIFSGDHLFVDSIGRTDFEFSDHLQMIESLKKIIAWAKPNDILCPGHNKIELFSDVLKNNIFLKNILD